MAELAFKATAKTGRICEAEVFGDRRDRLGVGRISQHGMGLEQPLALNVSSDTAGVFEQSIEIGSGHSDEPGQSLRL